MKKIFSLSAFLVLHCFLSVVFGTGSNISFSHFSVKEGLSQNTVFAIRQDSTGNIWFGTSDGVNKYDGYAFRVYRTIPGDSTSIAANVIHTIHRDSYNRMWFGTRNGLSLYDEKKDIFRNYAIRPVEKESEVTSIVDLDSTTLLVGTPSHLTLLNLETGLAVPTGLSEKNICILSMLKADDKVFAGTMHGLYLYTPATQSIHLYHEDFRNVRIQTLLLQKNQYLWVGTEGKGLYRIDLTSGNIRCFRSRQKVSGNLSSDYIRSLELDTHNQLWVGTFNDLNIYDETKDIFIKYEHDPFVYGSLSQNSIRSLFRDAQGGMWIGTYFGGVNYYHPLKNRFRTQRRTPGIHSLNDNNISCMTEDPQGNLWVGTLDGGLNKWDAMTGHFSNYASSSLKLHAHNIKALYFDKERNSIYIGAHAGGLSCLNLTTNQVTTFVPSNSSISDENIYAILPIDQDRLWIGALNGLSIYNRKTNQFKRLRAQVDCRKITYLLRDHADRLWIGTDRGLALYNILGEELIATHPAIVDSLRDVRVNSIYEAHNGEVWIASANGLYGVHKTQIRHYSMINGLPNNMIYGMLEDTFGRLWLSSNNGLSCLMPDAGKVKNYTDEDGVQSNQFNMYAFCHRKSGEMCFGGVDGITCFRPDLMRDNPEAPRPRIHELRVFNRTVRPDDHHGILSQSLEHTSRITLTSAQSVFSLGFVVSNYIAGKHNYFRYKLDGFDSEWYSAEGHNFVSYSNLPAGDYTFLVKAANNDGYWNDTPASLHITVLPVWYKTTWALLLFLLALIALIVFVFRYFWIQKSMKAEILLERREKEKTEELNQMKLRFFINISHELRTPLSLILDPLQEVIRSTSDRRIRSQLDYAQRNASRLLRLVNQLLDYRRAELGVLNLKVVKADLHHLLQESFASYEKLARNKQIRYTFESEIEGRILIADLNYLELMVNNLLSNAFKFTPEGESIRLSVRMEGDNLILMVRDTGIGIAPQQQARIFERFYQVNTEQTGSGIGLSLVKRLVELHHGRIEMSSVPAEETLFTIVLPQQETCYAAEEWGDPEPVMEDRTGEVANNDFLLLNEEAAGGSSEFDSQVTKKGKLLIVEDNDEIRRYLCDGLSDMFEVMDAENGQIAVEYLESNEVDVVLSDVMMPVMDGVKLCTLLKNNIRTSHIPVILLSAKIDEQFQLEAFKMGADDYIAKPFSMAMLTMKIRNQLRNRQRLYDHYSRSIEIEPAKISVNALDEEFLTRAKEIVEMHIGNIDFSTDDFSREMNMCRSNLHLKLKSITGESAIEFIRKVRFKRACELLEEGRLSVGEISTKVGFSSQSYFSSIFKKYLGCQPTEYVKKKKMLQQ